MQAVPGYIKVPFLTTIHVDFAVSEMSSFYLYPSCIGLNMLAAILTFY